MLVGCGLVKEGGMDQACLEDGHRSFVVKIGTPYFVKLGFGRLLKLNAAFDGLAG